MYKLFILLVLSLFLVNCNSSSTEEIEDEQVEINSNKMFSFLNSIDNIVALGKIDFAQIIEKSEAKEDALIGAILQGPLNSLEKISDNAPIYFCVTLDKSLIIPLTTTDLLRFSDTAPKGNVHLFLSVKNKEDLMSVFKNELNVDFEKEGNYYTASIESIDLVLDEDILFIQGNMDNKSSEKGISLLEKVKSSKKPSNLKTNGIDASKLLDGTEDLIFAYNLQKSVSLAQESMQLSDNEGLSTLKADLENCFNKSSIDFQNGKLVIKSENILSKQMDKWQVMGKNSSSVVSQLGKENASASLALNMDVKELQKIFNTYLFESVMELSFKLNMTEIKEIALFIKEQGIEKYFQGELGVSLYMEEGIPDFNVYAKMGSETMNMLRVPLQDIESAAAEFSKSGNTLKIKSSNKFANRSASSYSSVFQNYGDYPFNAYVDLSQINWSDLIPDRQAVNALSSLSSIKLWIEKDVFITEISVEDNSKNFLAFFIEKMTKLNLANLLQ